MEQLAKHNLKVEAPELLAALAYMVDLTSYYACYHSWRVALVADKLASACAPDIRRDVFYAGLMHDLGAVGAARHITEYSSAAERFADPHIRTHTHRSALFMSNHLPSMALAMKFVLSHHENWDGTGYPARKSGDEIPLGSSILRIADSADFFGCFGSTEGFASGLRALSIYAGREWPQDLWTVLIRSAEDAAFYRSLEDVQQLPGMIMSKIEEHGVPKDFSTDDGTDKIFGLFAAIVDAKEPATAGHCIRTANLAATIGMYMGLSDDELHTVYRAGMIHDCGKVALASSLLGEAKTFGKMQLAAIRRHAEMTMRIFNCIPSKPEMAQLGYIAGHDHERYDGAGYPDGLRGEAIPLMSRIICVADAFDAMSANDTYKTRVSPRYACTRVTDGSGKQFDPRVVEALLKAMEKGEVSSGLRAA